MSNQVKFYGSDDEEDYKAALEAQELFRAKHNGSRGVREPTSPAVHRAREGSENRRRHNKTPVELDLRSPPLQMAQISSGPARAGDLKSILMERQLKKEAAARELEERRKSLARRPSAPPIPHPDNLSPIISRPPTAFELPQTTFVPQDIPQRSHTADFTRSSSYMRSGNKPVIGLPATPKAMRLQFESDSRGKGQPSVPPIPLAYKTSPASSGQGSPDKPSSSSADRSPEKASPLTLLPSTVYSPPSHHNIQRCMSAPIPEEPMAPVGLPSHPSQSSGQHARRASVSRKMSVPDANAGNSMRGIDEMLGSGRHSRQPSRDDYIPPPPPPPPMLKELQHLAIPPPPPPAPLPGMRSPQVYGGAAGTIEIVMDEDDNVPVAAPISESTVPIIAAPAPPSSRNGHARGRSVSEKDNSIAGRISRATERMRSASRGRNSSVLGSRTMSPEQTSPYESVMNNANYASPPAAAGNPQMIERHPREVRAAYQQQQARDAYPTGLLESEMI